MSIVDDFIKAVENLAQNDEKGLNCFALFLIEQIFCEIQNKANSKDTVSVQLIEHPLPMDNRSFRSFLLLSRHRQELFEYHDVEAYAALIENGENFRFYCDARTQYFKGKKAYFTNWIAKLSAQFVSQLEVISQVKQVPLPSLAGIISAMIFPSERRIKKIIYKNNPKVVNDNALRIINIFTSKCESVCIPEDIPVRNRDQFIIGLNNKIYKLLMETFIVFMIEGRAESWAIHAFIKNEQDLSVLKNFMLERTCCEGMERRLLQISSKNDLEKYFVAEHSIFELIYPVLESLIEVGARGAADKYAYLLNIDNYPIIETESNEWNADLLAEIPSLFKLKSYDPTVQKKKELPEYATLDFFSEICREARKKLCDKPLKTYMIKGKTEHVSNYIINIVYNCSYSIIERQGLPAPGFHSSYRQVRRDDKQLRDGQYKEFIENNIEDPNNIKRIRDLSEKELEIFKNYKVQNMKHQQPGLFTQNQLIEDLRDPVKIAELKNVGIDIEGRTNKGFSPVTLKKKLKKLRDIGKISFDQTKNAIFYKQEDFNTIARAIADLINEP